MIKPTTSDMVIANEIIDALDNSTFSEKTKNSIICDYLDRAYNIGFEEGRKNLIDDMHLVAPDNAAKTIMKTIIKKATTVNGSSNE